MRSPGLRPDACATRFATTRSAPRSSATTRARSGWSPARWPVCSPGSRTVLLMTYIGGVGRFAGPVVGAVVLTWAQASLSGYTSAWQLYLGLFFMMTIVFAPAGLAGLIAMHAAIVRTR